MAGVLASRPSSFPSVEEAISWSLRTGMCRTREAACISMPSQLQLQRKQVGTRWKGEEEAFFLGRGGARMIDASCNRFCLRFVLSAVCPHG